METIFIEGTEMAVKIADRMRVPVFNFPDYLSIAEKAHVDAEMAKRLFLTVLKSTGEKNDIAVVCVDNSAEGRDEAKSLAESILQKNISKVSYVFFNYHPEWDNVEVIDGIEMLASVIKDQEVPFNISVQETNNTPVESSTGYMPPITDDLV